MATGKKPTQQDNALKAAGKASAQIGSELDDSFKSIGETIKNSVNRNIANSTVLTKDLIDQTKILGTATKGLGKNIEALNKGLLTTEDIQDKIETVEIKRKQLAEELVEAAKKGLVTYRQARSLITSINEQSAKQRDILMQQAKIGKLLEQQARVRLKIEELVVEKMGRYGKLMEGIQKIPIVGSLINADKVLAKMKKTATETGSAFKTAFVGAHETIKSIGDTLTSPAFLIGGLVSLLQAAYKLATEYEQKQFDAAKDLGVSVEHAKKLRDHFVDISKNNVMLGLLADDLQKAYAGVQDEMGIIVKQSDEFNVTTALIMRRTGATAEHMATMQYAALKTGKSMTGIYQSIVGSAKAMGARLKLDMSEKQIMDGISKVSATVLSNFKGNFSQLAKSVVEAKKLGTTLDKINGTQDQFLDFETSISKQFEAQVLTGEELDLSAARQYAENHDTAGLMREINRLMGDRAKWDKLGTLEQQAKAEALGMSRDTINEMYVTQEKTRLLGAAAGEDLKTQYDYLVAHGVKQKQIEDTLGAQAVQSIQQASTAERMATLMEGIKNTIGQMLQQFLPLVNKALEWLSHAENLRSVFVNIAKIVGAIVGYSLTLKMVNAANAVIQQVQLSNLARQNAALTQTIAKEAILTEERVGGAVASVTAGSGYLGPGALAVGGAVLAMLGAWIGSSMLGGAAEGAMGDFGAGGGGGAGNTDLSAGSGLTAAASSAPVAPSIPTPTAATSANSYSGGSSSGGSIASSVAPINITVNSVLDGQVLASAMVRHMPSEHSAGLDNNTAVG